MNFMLGKLIWEILLIALVIKVLSRVESHNADDAIIVFELDKLQTAAKYAISVWKENIRVSKLKSGNNSNNQHPVSVENINAISLRRRWQRR